MSQELYPTHSCFDDAFKILMQLIEEEGVKETITRTDIFIVHAICVWQGEGPNHGRKWGHAWFETKEEVWQLHHFEKPDGPICKSCSWKEDFYEDHAPIEVHKYTPHEANEMGKKYRHTGPWVEEINKFCSPPGTEPPIIGSQRVEPATLENPS